MGPGRTRCSPPGEGRVLDEERERRQFRISNTRPALAQSNALFGRGTKNALRRIRGWNYPVVSKKAVVVTTQAHRVLLLEGEVREAKTEDQRGLSGLKKSQPAGFEPTRAEPNGFLVHLRNRLDTAAVKLSLCSRVRCGISGSQHQIVAREENTIRDWGTSSVVERPFCIREAVGSNPTFSRLFFTRSIFVPVVQHSRTRTKPQNTGEKEKGGEDIVSCCRVLQAVSGEDKNVCSRQKRLHVKLDLRRR